jgi:membrane fusion protein, multidrug efflux system
LVATGEIKPMKHTQAILLSAVLLAGCEPEQPPAPAAQPVQTFVLRSGVEQSFRRFPGEVSATRTSEMSFPVAGRLIERPASQGMLAEEGVLLARLDPENFQSRLDSANARLVNARDELARRRQLRDRGVIAASEFDRFSTDFEVAVSEQRTAQRALDDTRLVAPHDGRVARMLVNNFQNVQAKQPVLVFQDVSSLEVDIEVPERLMSSTARGITVERAREILEAKVEFPAVPGKIFDLELESFSTEATPAARTFRVSFKLVPPEGINVLPGMTSTVLLRLRGEQSRGDEVEDAFEVPVPAVGTVDGRALVWRLDPDAMTVEPVPVELLSPAGQIMRVRGKELRPGDEIVISGVRFLSDGLKVGRRPGAGGP